MCDEANAFIIWMKPGCRFGHVHQRLLLRRGQRKSDIEHPVRKLKLRSLTLGACARGLQHLLCVFVCPASANAIKRLLNTAIGFLLSIEGF